jgi:FtsX-like permease family protein
MSRDGGAGLRRWAADLAMGARFAVSGGREGWARTVLTAVGVGLGVAVLLVAASVPYMNASHDARADARQGKVAGRSDHSLLVLTADGEYHGTDVLGRLLQPDGVHPAHPPGVRALPGPGEMVVSPALNRLLASPDGALLRKRLPWRVTGLVGNAGLLGPQELVYYAGADHLTTGDAGRALRFGRFGDAGGHHPVDPMLVLLIVVVCVVLLLPVAAFVAAAVRFGSERRDRRLAALRLIGADARMTRREAAGEAAVGALFGLLVGAAVFLPLRWSAHGVRLFGMSWFSSDVRPDGWLVLLILAGVPATAVAVSLLAMRGVAVEPLGVVRRPVPRRRRVWWRLVPTVAGLALLAPLARRPGRGLRRADVPDRGRHRAGADRGDRAAAVAAGVGGAPDACRRGAAATRRAAAATGQRHRRAGRQRHHDRRGRGRRRARRRADRARDPAQHAGAVAHDAPEGLRTE